MRLILLAVVCAFTLTSLIDSSEARRRGSNCGLKCFRYRKCMGQVAGNDNRPSQLGDTGQIVLNKCDFGKCDCEAEAAKKTSTTTTPKPEPKRTSNTRNRFSPAKIRPRKPISRPRSLLASKPVSKPAPKTAPIRGLGSRFTPRIPRKEPSKVEVLGVSVTSSSSSSSDTDEVVEEEEEVQDVAESRMESFRKRLERLRRRRFY